MTSPATVTGFLLLTALLISGCAGPDDPPQGDADERYPEPNGEFHMYSELRGKPPAQVAPSSSPSPRPPQSTEPAQDQMEPTDQPSSSEKYDCSPGWRERLPPRIVCLEHGERDIIHVEFSQDHYPPENEARLWLEVLTRGKGIRIIGGDTHYQGPAASPDNVVRIWAEIEAVTEEEGEINFKMDASRNGFPEEDPSEWEPGGAYGSLYYQVMPAQE